MIHNPSHLFFPPSIENLQSEIIKVLGSSGETLESQNQLFKQVLSSYQTEISKIIHALPFDYSPQNFFGHSVQAKRHSEELLKQIFSKSPEIKALHTRMLQLIPHPFHHRLIREHLDELLFLSSINDPKLHSCHLNETLDFLDNPQIKEEIMTAHRFDITGTVFNKLAPHVLKSYLETIQYPDYLSIEWGLDNILPRQIEMIQERFSHIIGLHLGFSGNGYPTIKSIGTIVSHFPSAKSIMFNTRSYIDYEEDQWKKLFESMKNIEELGIHGDQILYHTQAQGIKELFGIFQKLKYFTFTATWLEKLPPEKLFALFSSLSHIKGIQITESLNRLSQAQIISIFSPLKSLRSFSIQASPETFLKFQELCPHLPNKHFPE